MTNILGIPGSLREYSTTARLLSAVLDLCDERTHRRIFNGIAEMPHFSPDIDDESQASPAVISWRENLAWADGIVICTPEYAFGVPGSFKNALDWAVSSGELNGKPVIAISASPLKSGGSHALSSLLPTLRALWTVVVDGGAISVPFIKSKLSPSGEIIDDHLKDQMTTVMMALVGIK